ncbi:MAG: paraquat-inducible membrane protein A [Desulfobulbaceae bacterium]|nr:MAG: paraquat-inducible membrane protein A [Desulfobulbaceae bacterium]
MADFFTAKQSGMVSCHRCHLLCGKPSGKGYCPRCGEILHSRKPNSISRTWALVIAALIFYIPANVLPITHTTTLGTIQSDSIMSGVIFFIQFGSWGIALIIFIASVFVPLMKILILIMLLLSVQFKWQWRPLDRTRLYRITEAIGRWSMLDIFVVTILVALLQLGALANMKAGSAALYFAAVVVITMFAAETFDPRLIWDNIEDVHDNAD